MKSALAARLAGASVSDDLADSPARPVPAQLLRPAPDSDIWSLVFDPARSLAVTGGELLYLEIELASGDFRQTFPLPVFTYDP